MDNIDDEWSKFLANQSDSRFGSTTINNYCIQPINTSGIQDDMNKCNDNEHNAPNEAPECQDLYISTKTKVLFLNQSIDSS